MKKPIKSPYTGKIEEAKINEGVKSLVERAKNAVDYIKPPRKAILIRKDGFRTEVFFDGLPPTYKIPKKKDMQVLSVSSQTAPVNLSTDYIEFYRADFNEDVKIYKEL